MPIMQYRCEDCGARFDAFVRSPEEMRTGEIACRKCGSSKVRSMFSLIGDGVPERPQMLLECGECDSCEGCETRPACGHG